jgi:Protein of unknown function (DUF4019)
MACRGRSPWSVHYFVAICTVGILLCSCGSSSKNLELAKQNVQQFHSELDSGQYAAVYAACDEKFHAATTESDFVKILDAVHRKLGNVQQATLRNTGVAWYSGQGATVTLVYDTKFAEGTGTEQFVWHVKDNGAALYGYHINSNELVTK